MCSLKIIVTIYLAFSCHGRALALNATPGVENPNDHIQHPQKTSVQPEEIHNLFFNAPLAQIDTNDTAAVSDKTSVSSINDTLPKSGSQDLGSPATSTVTSVTPTLASVSGTSTSRLIADPVSDQTSSTTPVTHTVEFPLEGGGVVTSASDHSISKVDVSTQSNESLSLDKLYSDMEQSNKTSTVVGRKGADYKPSKIVPRKGVGSCPCCPNATSTENCTVCCISPNESSSKEEIDEKGEMSIQGLGNGTTTNPDNNTLIEQRINSSTVTSLAEAKKTKATKPLYTVDAANDNVGNVSAIQTTTKKLEQGSNYVVPVVGTILMVPLIAVLSVFMYKKGCEFWERRHYRRMDFLIDGMYND